MHGFESAQSSLSQHSEHCPSQHIIPGRHWMPQLPQQSGSFSVSQQPVAQHCSVSEQGEPVGQQGAPSQSVSSPSHSSGAPG